MKLPFHRRLQAALALAAFFFQTLAPFASAQQATGVPQLLNYQGRVTVGGTNFTGTGWFKFSLVDGGVNQNRTATAIVKVNGAGEINGVEVADGGSGYLTPPAVTIQGTGTGAEVDAFLEDGQVSEFDVRDGGGGYSTVTETIAHLTAPPANIVPTTFWSNDGSGVSGAEPQAAVARSVTKGLYSVLLGDADMQPLPAQVFANPDVRLRVWFSAAEDGPFTLLTPDQRIAAVGYALMAEDVKDGAITTAKLAADAVTLAQLSPELRQSIQSIQAWQATQLPVITSPAAADTAIGAAFTYQITASGSPLSYAATGLPAGWTVNTTSGLISATPAAAGTVTFNVTATNVAGQSPPKGVTVTVLGPVYVDFATGHDGNAGTQAAPVKTIVQGLAIAHALPALREVHVSSAAHTISATVNLKSGARLLGGYDRAAGWSRTAPRTPVNYFGGPAPAAGSTLAVFNANNLTKPVLVDGFAIDATLAPTSARSSSAGVSIKNCINVVLTNNSITAGNGGFGTAGANGAAGADGEDGGDAGILGVVVPHPDSGDPIQIAGRGIPGNSAATNGAGRGGQGGYGAFLVQHPYAPTETTDAVAVAGEAGFGANGGAGGDAFGNGAANAPSGAPGTDGSQGLHGAPGLVQTAAVLGTFGDFVTNSGRAGSDGDPGGGGGGGGGGGRITSGTVTQQFQTGWRGGSGGGGGEGGGGGKGGAGGAGGGGSFAVTIYNSTVRISGCQLTTFTGGPGGAGGDGGIGGAGGQGGNGYVTPVFLGANPGNGGRGGDGAAGRNGGGGTGGTGGPSIGIVASAASNLTQSGNTFTLGNAGAGGPGGLRPGFLGTQAPSGPAGVRQNILTGVAP